MTAIPLIKFFEISPSGFSGISFKFPVIFGSWIIFLLCPGSLIGSSLLGRSTEGFSPFFKPGFIPDR